MLYFGSIARHKRHGMQRIDYSILLEYDARPFKFRVHQIYMYIRRTFMLSLIMAPCYSGPIFALQQVQKGAYKFKWYT